MSNHYKILKQMEKPRMSEMFSITMVTIGVILYLGLISFIIRFILFGIILGNPV